MAAASLVALTVGTAGATGAAGEQALDARAKIKTASKQIDTVRKFLD